MPIKSFSRSFKIVAVVFAIIFAFFLGDFLFSQKNSPFVLKNTQVTFDHKLHGENIGLNCEACHVGSKVYADAYMPNTEDCLNCHRLPLTENPGTDSLEIQLKLAPKEVFSHKKILPEQVVFHHGVHAAAGVSCEDCHGNGYKENKYGGENFKMETCLACHRGKTFKGKFKLAPTYCGACHR